MTDIKSIESYFKTLQDEICQALERADGKAKFHEDSWERPGGGGGRTRVLKNGAVIEKGGVNFSMVHGTLPENMLQTLGVEGSDFKATGVSIVLHPKNPMVPIIHMNVRYFELDENVWWFGGGIDLTPHYVNRAQAKWFHQQLEVACNKTSDAYYPRFKKWADDYFFIPHRGETRGVGGIFFDRLNEDSEGRSKEDLFAFVQDVGNSFAPIYTHFMNENAKLPFNDQNKQWQLLRRGRYVEFNLVYDRGTKFGLQTNGRIESILMSLPQMASWEYEHHVEPNSKEDDTLNLLKKNIDWIA